MFATFCMPPFPLKIQSTAGLNGKAGRQGQARDSPAPRVLQTIAFALWSFLMSLFLANLLYPHHEKI